MADVAVKICGITTLEAQDAAITAGAGYLGYVFYPRSPRAIVPADAAALARRVPPAVQRVGLLVDPDDAQLQALLAAVPLEILQCHGRETPERLAQIRALTGRRVMKALSIAGVDDFQQVPAFAAVADLLLFDARPPATSQALPGGNGIAFDWHLLHGRTGPQPWMLAGGLTPDSVATAIRIARPPVVDVSSGVESSPGRKDPARIRAFLAAVAAA